MFLRKLNNLTTGLQFWKCRNIWRKCWTGNNAQARKLDGSSLCRQASTTSAPSHQYRKKPLFKSQTYKSTCLGGDIKVRHCSNGTSNGPPGGDDKDSKSSSRAHDFGTENVEDKIFDVLATNGYVHGSQFMESLQSFGLQPSDPRLQETFSMISNMKDPEYVGKDVQLDREAFKKCIQSNIVLIRRAFNGEFIIPEYMDFCSTISEMYWKCRTNSKGQVANYIPQLSRYSPDYWAVAICTIDGQRCTVGDSTVPFCLQSCSKPLTYALAIEENGADVVHNYVGQEPSGHGFNKIMLDMHNKPHNPLINSGAIVSASLVKNHLRLPDRFDYATQQYKKLTGGEYVAFNNAVFLSERETGDRNYALGYYMKGFQCFPDGVNLQETLDFYFQLCSTEVTTESASVIAATLANGGVNPLTGENILSGVAVRNTMSLMHSCGMYDYSGQFAFKVGLPAKSGVSGAILVVVPNVMGICVWSPPLDRYGNSVRGIQFCDDLINRFNFHYFDNLQYSRHKTDPRRPSINKEGSEVVGLLFGAKKGDVSALRRMYLSGMDMQCADYDGRTALHIAASEGHLECVDFLVRMCGVKLDPRDRWNRTPLEDAISFDHPKTAALLRELGGEGGTPSQPVGSGGKQP